MSQPNSSTFSSERAGLNAMKAALRSLFWILCGLAVIDILINVVFAYPSDPKATPSSLQLYFDYGRSVEGRLRRENSRRPGGDRADNPRRLV